MTTTAIRWTLGIFRVAAIAAAIAGFGLAQAQTQTPAKVPEPALFEMREFGVVPRPAVTAVLLRMPAVEQELKLTEAQKKQCHDLEKEEAAKIREARSQRKDQAEFLTTRTAIMAEAMTALVDILKPEQRERLTQIQLQAQGPLAFWVREGQERVLIDPQVRFIGPRLSTYLKMSPDQVKRARELAQQGRTPIENAATFKIPWDPKEKPTAEAIRKFVEGPKFQAAKADTRRSARITWDAEVERILALLNDEQRASYRKLVGKPFDFTNARIEDLGTETDADVRTVTVALRALGAEPPAGGSDGGQRADPNFNVTVANPALVSMRPAVAIDEAHNNFHTAGGRYKPFADLITGDGCVVTRNTTPLDGQSLGRCQILVSANASVDGGQGTGDAKSAFTPAECDAVQRWVWAGGALLVITDHEPFGSASQALAQRFGVVMNTSGTDDPAHYDQKYRGLVFTRQDGLVLDHPITLGRDPSEQVNRVETFYGQALIGPVGSTPFLRFANTAVYESDNGERSAAGWAQGVALEYGAGRVVVMGEAAELSAQLAGAEPMGMNVAGIDNRQMALNIVRWLARSLDPQSTAMTSAADSPARPQCRLFPRIWSGTGLKIRRAAGLP